jgi:two-component system chemotaxis sensor kinase CheA
MDDMLENDEMAEILHDFLVETSEILETVDQQLIELEQNPEDLEILNGIFRGVHTIKGASGFLGLKQLVDVAHKAEEVLNKYRQGTLKVTPTGMDALLAASDMLSVLMEHVSKKDGVEEDLTAVLAALAEAEGGEAPEAPESEAPAEAPAAPTSEASPEASEAPAAPASEAPAPEAEETKEESTAEAETPSAVAPAPEASSEEAKAPEAEKKSDFKVRKDDVDTIRVDTARLDSVMNMVGELVLGRNRLARIASRLEDRHPEDNYVGDLLQNSTHLNAITTDLQVAVMQTRMQAIVKVFGRFPRMVRDLARDKKKDVNLVLVGQETELDKTVIEEIGDPMVHLVRNSVDHGIELPEERSKAGKPRTGTLTLSAFHKGNNIFVTIEDDGKGIDVEGVKKKAIEKGIATSDELERMGKQEILNMIFLPGFSTAKKITDTSGRGVGMDVVKTNITKLNGSIDIESTVGVGSKMILRLPLTLAIIQALMCGVGDDEYALPLSSVVEILHVEGTEISTVEGKETLYFRDRVYPLIRLSNMVDTESEKEAQYAILMSHGDKVFGLMVEKLIGQEEVVIKSMGNYLANTRGVSGATITGDGRVVLIIDIMGLYTSL